MASIKTRGRTKTSGSGARYTAYRKPKQYELSGKSTMTTVGNEKIKVQRERSGIIKQRLLQANKVNLLDPKTKKFSVVDVEAVIENPANAQYVRRNIITKGCVVQTSKGKARITSKPGQQGYLNAVLVQ